MLTDISERPIDLDLTSSGGAGRTLGARNAYAIVKRGVDLVGAGLGIAVLAVPGTILSAFIARSTHGSPLYTQTRIGRGGKPFRIWKFRTMVSDSDDVEKYLNEAQLDEWRRERKVRNDPRITRLGAVLRKKSIDEFPNLINVFLGHMSLVGPRPIVEDELHWYGDRKSELLAVRPGMTGLWQVTKRNDADYQSGKRQQIELCYVRNISLFVDAGILIRTIGAFRRGTGV